MHLMRRAEQPTTPGRARKQKARARPKNCERRNVNKKLMRFNEKRGVYKPGFHARVPSCHHAVPTVLISHVPFSTRAPVGVTGGLILLHVYDITIWV